MILQLLVRLEFQKIRMNQQFLVSPEHHSIRIRRPNLQYPVHRSIRQCLECHWIQKFPEFLANQLIQQNLLFPEHRAAQRLMHLLP